MGLKKIKEAFSTDKNENVERRSFLKYLPASAAAFLFAERAEAGTWTKLAPASSTLTPPAGTEILKANSGGQLANATAGTDYAKPNTSSTWTAKQTFNTAIHEKQAALAGTAIDVSSASVFTKTISGATTFTVSNVPASGNVGTFILELTNGGSATITWWAGVKWPNGTAPTLTSSGKDILGFYTWDGGTVWNGILLGKDVK